MKLSKSQSDFSSSSEPSSSQITSENEPKPNDIKDTKNVCPVVENHSSAASLLTSESTMREIKVSADATDSTVMVKEETQKYLPPIPRKLRRARARAAVKHLQSIGQLPRKIKV